jgi:hypothetical protein
MVSRYALIVVLVAYLILHNQAIIFVVKREFMLIGWMVIYILS